MAPEEMAQEPKVESMTAGVPQEGKEIDPAVASKINGYSTVIMKLLHGKKTRDAVVKMIKSSDDPFMAVPQAAMQVNDMAVNIMEQEGKQVDYGIQLAASPALISDLLELGVATKQWGPPTEDEIAGIMEDTIQMGVERGLKDGSIDPIQLQMDVEPLMNENQRRFGETVGNEQGIDRTPSPQAMINVEADKKVRLHEQRAAKKGAKAALKGGQ